MSRIATITLAAASLVPPALAEEEPLHFAFDHVGWMVDQDTLDMLAESSVLAEEFAHTTVRRSPDGVPFAVYVYGKLSYLEFMLVDAARQIGLDVAAGDGMVAFNAEEEGSVDRIIARMGEQYPESNPQKGFRTLNLGEQSIPWFHTALFDYQRGHEGFGAWVKEYHREFKNQATGGRSPIGDVTRIRDAPPVSHHPDKLLEDVVSLTAAVPDTRRRNLVNLLTELGYEVDERGTTTVLTGAENVLRLIPRTDQKYVITSVELSLTRKQEGEEEYRFGSDIVLRFEDGRRAVWEFGGSNEDLVH